MRVVQVRAILEAGQRAKGFLGIVNVTLRLICLPKNLMRKSSDALQGSKRDTMEGILVEKGGGGGGWWRQHSFVHETADEVVHTSLALCHSLSSPVLSLLCCLHSIHATGLPLALSLSNCPYKQQQLGLIGPGLDLSASGSGRERVRQLSLDTIRFLWRHIWCAGHMCVSIVMKLWGLLSLSQNELSY